MDSQLRQTGGILPCGGTFGTGLLDTFEDEKDDCADCRDERPEMYVFRRRGVHNGPLDATPRTVLVGTADALAVAVRESVSSLERVP